MEKIVEIDRHIGCAMSGLQADARSMIEHARVESQNHAFNYAEPLRVESCTQAICDLALRFGEGAEGEESIMSRPFGVALLIAGYDEDGPSLYVTHTQHFPRLDKHTSTPTVLSTRKKLIVITATTPSPQAHSTATTPKPSAPDPRARRPNSRTNSTSRLPCLKPRCSRSRRSSRSWRRSWIARTCSWRV